MTIAWQYHPYVLYMIICAIVTLSVAIYVWQHHPVTGSKELILMLADMAVWSLAAIVELGGRNSDTMLLGLKLQALGENTVMVFWFLFILEYARRRHWFDNYKSLLLFLVPGLSIVFIWTLDWNPLFYKQVWIDDTTSPWTLYYEPGLWYFINTLYNYVLPLIGTLLLALRFAHTSKLYRQQIGTLLVATLIPWGTSFLYLIKIFPRTFPAGPIAFTICGLIFAWSLYKYRLLDIVPIARERLVEWMEDAVIVLDPERRIVDMNPSAEKLFPNGEPQWIGRPASEILPEPIYAIINSSNTNHTEVILEREDTQNYYDLHISPLHKEQQRHYGWLLNLHDITELRKAQQQAEEANAVKSQFVSNVSHELRTPLTNIKLYLGLLNSGQEAKRAMYSETLARETDRLQGLIEDLLNISRLDLGKITFIPALLDINNLIQTLVNDREELFNERGLRLTFKHNPLPSLQADKKLLEQVITNLLTNALNYTLAGSVTIKTDTIMKADGNWITIAVQDTGLGIGEKEQQNLFQRFYRGASSQEAKIAGTGLGLAISQEIIELHNGYITCESTKGAGSTFTIWLPVRK